MVFTILVITLVSISFVLLTRSNGNKTDAAWFDYSWQNRQRLTFTNSGSEINEDRKVKFEIDTATLVSSGKLQSNCADIRFTDVTGKLLDYFIDTAQGDCNTASTHFYVKLSKIISGDQSIYVYYSNPSAPSVQKNDFFADNTLGEGLVGYWPMEDNVSGNGQTILDYAGVNNGTTSDANASGMDCTVSGKVGNACDFDGVDDYVNTQLTLSTIQTAFTACVWGQYDQITTGYAWLVGEDTGGTNTDHFILGKSGTAGTTHYRFNSFTGSGVNNSLPIDDGGWHQLCYTYDGAVGKYYFDGADTGSTNNGTANFANSGTLQIGRRNFASENWGGLIDDARIYSRALTSSEVSQIYNAGSGSTIPVPLTFTPDSTNTASEEIGPGPVLYLSFDEGQGTTTYDQSGKGNNGTITGATWQTEDKCISGKCLYFDGSGDYVKVGDNDTLDVGTDSYSISLWYKTGNGTNYMGLVNNGGATAGAGGHGYNLVMPNSWDPGAGYMMLIQADGSNADSTTYINSDLYNNQWHQVTVSKSDTSLDLYIDGKLVKQDSNIQTTDIDSPTSPFLIGSWSTSSNYFNGFIDEVRIYPYALTAAQVKADYTAKGGGAKGLTAYVNDDKYKSLGDGLVGYWPMEETAENTCSGGEDLCDKSGNDNHGVLGSTAVLDSAKFGNGSSFTVDANSYVDLGADTIYNPGTGSMTYSFWAKLPTQSPLNHWYEYIAKQGDWNTGSTIEVTSRYALIRHNGVSYGRQYSYIDDNTWHHVVAIFDRDVTNKISVYIDGQKDQTFPDGDISALSGIDLQPTYNLYLNKGFHGTAPVEGLFDEVRIYNRALTPAEVQNLYEWAPGPVAHYTMDDGVSGDSQTIIDSSGNGNNGTTVDGANNTGMDCTVQGQYGGACEFDGVDDHFYISEPLTSTAPNNFTITGWVNPQGNVTYKYFINPTSNGIDQMVGYDPVGKRLFVQVTEFADINNRTRYSQNNSVPEGEWRYFAVSIVDKEIKIYINGELDSSYSETIDIAGWSQNWYIGSRANSTFWFKGRLDDVRIYNYALTPKQIRNIMNARPADAPAVGSPLGSPIAHYTFDEGYGTTAYDSVGGYNGTFGGATNPAWVGGKYGKALNFAATNGNDGSRVTYTGDDLDIGTNTGDELTLSMWLKPDTSQTNSYAYLVRNGWGADENYGFYLTGLSDGNYKMGAQYYDGAFRTINSVNRFVPAGQWSHLIIKIDQGTSISYYINGELKETVSWVGNSSVSSNSTFNIGGHAGTSAQSYDGLIDEIKIYNFALTEDEIAQDYNQSSRLTLGTTSTESDGSTSSNSSDRSYCVPGDTATCDPPVFEMTFDQQKVSGAGQTIYDTSGNGNNGTTSSANGTGMNCSVAGKVGNACEFDGVDDYIDMGDVDLLDSMEALTISMWVAPDTPGGQWGGYVGKITAHPAYEGFLLQRNNNDSSQISWYGFGTSDNRIVGDVELARWNYVVGMWDGEEMSLYINGKLVGSKLTSVNVIDAGSQTLKIGRLSYAGNQSSGLIDQVRIYDYARTPAQIAWEYNQGAPVAWYKFDECQGTTIYDWSENANGQSNGNHGSLTIGASGNQTSAGTCDSGTSSQAWNNGTTGKWGSAFSGDGVDDSITFGDTSFIPTGGDPRTVSIWFKPNATNLEALFSYGANSGGQLFELIIMSNGITGLHWYGNNVTTQFPNTKYTQGVWQNLILTYDSSTIKTYINGVHKDTVSQTLNTNNSNVFHIGKPIYLSNGNDEFDGLIDDVRIYNYALTPDQVKSVYNDGAINFR